MNIKKLKKCMDIIMISAKKHSYPNLNPKDNRKKAIDNYFNIEANVNLTPNDHFAYEDGYKIAGDILIKNIDTYPRDFLIYPIFYNYRHYIELALKLRIYIFKNEPIKIHSIKELYDKLKDLVEANVKKTLNEIKSDIMWFNDYDDKQGSVFRYSKNTKNEQSIPTDITSINLEELKKRIDKIEKGLNKIPNIFSKKYEHYIETL